MKHTVRIASRLCRQVAPTHSMNRPGPTPTSAAVMIVESRIAVPVASGWNTQLAA